MNRGAAAPAFVSVLCCLALAACCDLQITNDSLPDGRVGEEYDFQFEADCDNGEWELTSELPPGLSFRRSGALSGTPTQAGTYPLTVTVGGQDQANADFVSKGFSLTIVQPVGTLEITVSTTGAGSDPDGYTVNFGNEQFQIGVNETLTFTDRPVGPLTVNLGGLATNCSVVGENPQTVTIVENVVTRVTFEVACGAVRP